MTQIVIGRRYNGPVRSANGGYTAGALAAELTGRHPAVEVTLRLPPPLEVPMTVKTSDSGPGITLSQHGSLVAEARPVDTVPAPLDAVSLDEAVGASAGFRGFADHPFPGCFGCGPAREEGDGLRIFPGDLGGAVAAPWTPHPSLSPGGTTVDTATTWGALDCIGAWSTDLAGRALVLGRMTATLDSLPMLGRPHVVVGALRGVDGRKTFTSSTLYTAEGTLVARAEHIWIEVDPSAFN